MGVTISGKIDFKTKFTKKDKEGHYIVIKRSVQEEDITLVNMLTKPVQYCKVISIQLKFKK